MADRIADLATCPVCGERAGGPACGCCRIWPDYVNGWGYGATYLPDVRGGKRTQVVHRWVVEQVLGVHLGRAVQVMHRCDRRACFLFDHLVVGDGSLNTLDAYAKGR